MFNIELIRKDFENTLKKLEDKKYDTSNLKLIKKLDEQNRELQTKIQNLNNQKNELSKKIGLLIRNNENQEISKIQNQVQLIKNELEKLENQKLELNFKLKNLLDLIPNICQDNVPIGEDERQNIEVKKFKTPNTFNFTSKAHWEIAKDKELIDFERSSKIFGSRFIIYKNKGAKLFRALQQFTLDHNIENGYNEILPPVLLLKESLYGSGQLPKFKEDLFSIDNDKFYLSPTAEVQLLNFHRNEIIDRNHFPIKYTANTPCFRSEAGSAGRDTRGVIRQHQFWKSELVVFCLPENSEKEHENMTRVAEQVLEKLNLPYRRLLLCTGDTGFSSQITYDLEVWMPSYNEYKEISSCSNCGDFQARRSQIRTKIDNKNILVHTLNGSSLAIDRLWAAIIENNQQKDGTIKIPELLIPYCGFKEI